MKYILPRPDFESVALQNLTVAWVEVRPVCAGPEIKEVSFSKGELVTRLGKNNE